MAKGKRNVKGASLKLLASLGWLAADVETWIRGTLRTRDLLGLFDIMAWHDEHGILGLQVTNRANLGNHITAVVDSDELSESLARCLRAGMRVEYWGWRPEVEVAKGAEPILARHFALERDEEGEHVVAYDGSQIIGCTQPQ